MTARCLTFAKRVDSWCKGKYPEAMIASETRLFSLGSLAIATNTPDKDVWDRQEPEWLDILIAVHRNSGPQPEPPLSELLKLPLGTEIMG